MSADALDRLKVGRCNNLYTLSYAIFPVFISLCLYNFGTEIKRLVRCATGRRAKGVKKKEMRDKERTNRHNKRRTNERERERELRRKT